MNSLRKNLNLLGFLILSSVLLTACETSKFHLGPKLGIKIPIEEKQTEAQAGDKSATEEPLKFSQLDNNEDANANAKKAENQTFKGSGRFISGDSRKVATEKRADGKYSMNFDAADLGEVAKIILSDMLQENYVISPKVSGSVSLQTTKPLRKDELLPTLEMLLRINNAAMIKRDGIYIIEPGTTAVQGASTSALDKKGLRTGYQIKIIPLQFVGAIDMADLMTPIVAKTTILKVDPARNILMVGGTKTELEKIIDLVNTFDVNFIKGMSFGLYPLENTEVDSTLAEIEQIFNKGEKSPLAGMLRFISIKHLNAIMVVTQQREYLKEAEKWINRLDVQNGVVGEGGLVVYRVQHVDAVALAGTLNEVISGVASNRQKPPSVAPGQKVASLSNKANKTPRRNIPKVNTGANKGNSSLEGVSVIADEPNNALIIMAQPQQYRMLNKIIKQLDVMPLQVLIDAMIVSVTLTDELEHGVQWRFKNGLGDFDGLANSSASASNLFTSVAGAVSKGFTYGLLDTDLGIHATFDAFAKDNKINVLSTPSIMVLNNHEANILVGDSIPTRTGEFTNVASGAGTGIQPLTNTSIQNVETGVTLNVKPRVNANGVVILEIEQKVNNVASAATNTGSSIDSPTILKREIKSTVAVVDGESIVLGGLISETHDFDNSGIPLLKDIPYLGWLFGRQIKKVNKNELIVVITPRVIENKYDARKVTNEFKRKLPGIFYDKEGYEVKWNEVERDSNGREVIFDDIDNSRIIDNLTDQSDIGNMYRRTH